MGGEGGGEVERWEGRGEGRLRGGRGGGRGMEHCEVGGGGGEVGE